jgi:hypothetical protein
MGQILCMGQQNIRTEETDNTMATVVSRPAPNYPSNNNLIIAMLSNTVYKQPVLPSRVAINTLLELIANSESIPPQITTNTLIRLLSNAMFSLHECSDWHADVTHPLLPWIALYGFAKLDFTDSAAARCDIYAVRAVNVLNACSLLVQRFPGLDHTPLLWPLLTQAVQDMVIVDSPLFIKAQMRLRRLLGHSLSTRISVLRYLRLRVHDCDYASEVAAWLQLLDLQNVDLYPPGVSLNDDDPGVECTLTMERFPPPLAHFGADTGEATGVAPWCLLRAAASNEMVGLRCNAKAGLRSPFTREPLTYAQIPAAHPALVAAAAAATKKN